MAAKTLSQKISLGCGGLFLLFILLCVAAVMSGPSTPPVKHIPYEDVTRSDAGQDTQILIDPKYVNAEDMLLLGRQLAKEKANEDYVFMGIFSDRRAAELYKKIITDTVTPEEDAFYIRHYVGQYNKNNRTNFGVYTVQLNGLDVDDNDLGDDVRYEPKDLE